MDIDFQSINSHKIKTENVKFLCGYRNFFIDLFNSYILTY